MARDADYFTRSQRQRHAIAARAAPTRAARNGSGDASRSVGFEIAPRDVAAGRQQ